MTERPEAPTSVDIDRAELSTLCRDALLVSASWRVANLLTDAALHAEDRGATSHGVSHLLDYIAAMDAGRLDGHAVPNLRREGAVTVCDARQGILHTGFDMVFERLVSDARAHGVVVLAQSNGYAGGQIAWFTDRLATRGLVALATSTSPALIATGPETGRVFGTNPMAYAVPRATQPPVSVDQASSVTAYMNIKQAAARGDSIPDHWALDAEGRATTDPVGALDGALLPFGGYKGANIALLVDLLSSMAGGTWSIDAPPFDRGPRCPSIGMFLLVLDPGAFSDGYPARVEAHVDRLEAIGVRRTPTAARAQLHQISVLPRVLEALQLRRG